MKTVVQVGYGSADVLELREIDRPVAADGEVLVRVHAAPLAANDSFGPRGAPFPSAWASGGPCADHRCRLAVDVDRGHRPGCAMSRPRRGEPEVERLALCLDW
jgi:hypothetical protein